MISGKHGKQQFPQLWPDGMKRSIHWKVHHGRISVCVTVCVCLREREGKEVYTPDSVTDLLGEMGHKSSIYSKMLV